MVRGRVASAMLKLGPGDTNLIEVTETNEQCHFQ